MELTRGQNEALAMVKRLLAKDGHAVAVLGGYAGTGKTTLLKTIAETFGIPVVIAPTGKAAARVKEAAGIGAMTCHRWMYSPITDMDTGHTIFARKPPDVLPIGSIGLLVVEEASMIGRDLWNDILDNAKMLKLKVLLMGDPFQLSPVESQEEHREFSVLDPRAGFASEYVLLKEVMRQALESPVIRASMAIREGSVEDALALLPLVPYRDFTGKAAEVQQAGGVILCYKNITRHWANNEIRKKLGFTEDIQPGEPVVVLKNNYNLGAYNGETYAFKCWTDLTPSKHSIYERRTKVRESSRFGIATLEDKLYGTNFNAVLAQEELFGRLSVSTHAIDTTADISFRGMPTVHANLGYVLTTHKSQGSEWDEVLVAIEPSMKFFGKYGPENLRWLYTAVTRAKSRCYISLGATAPVPPAPAL